MATHRTLPKLTVKDKIRFWQKARRPLDNECWQWRGSLMPNGYGVFWAERQSRYAHRIAYQIANPSMNPQSCICHRCDNKRCVNPAHLFAGSYGDNVRDCVKKGRNDPSPGEKNGRAKLTPDTVRAIRRQYALGGRTMVVLAKQFGVCPMTIHHITARKTWKHVT